MGDRAVIERLLHGAVDFHVHPAPDPFRERRLDVLDLARQASDAGMRAIVAKNHHFGTALLARLASTLVPDFALIGSLALNRETGGLNPEVVAAAARAGAKVVWMPTSSSVLDSKGRPGISLLDGEGKLLPEVEAILEVMKRESMVLGTGHVSLDEIYAVTRRARQMGITVTVTHPLTAGFGCTLTLRQQQELVAMGAFIEHCFVACMPDLGGMSPRIMVDHIRAAGPAHCILSTDFGQPTNPAPPEGFRMMIGVMLRFGLSEGDLELLVKTNPARILGLDVPERGDDGMSDKDRRGKN